MIKFRELGIHPLVKTAITLGVGPITNILMTSLAEEIHESRFKDKNIEKKLLSLLPGDVIICDLGMDSFYLNPEVMSDKLRDELINLSDKEGINTINPTSLNGFVIKSVKEQRRLIVKSDNDPTAALAHEIGHLVHDDTKLGNVLQSRSWLRGKDRLNKIISMGTYMFTKSVSLTLLAPVVLGSPILYNEFMASYYGLNLLKKVGCTEAQLEEAKKLLSCAWGTYLTGLVHHGASGLMAVKMRSLKYLK